jgi:hypothetical protein
VRADQSTRRLSLAARNELWRVRATRLGVVVNGISMRKHSYGYAYGDGYGYYGYSSDDRPNLEVSRPSNNRPALTADKSAASDTIPLDAAST